MKLSRAAPIILAVVLLAAGGWILFRVPPQNPPPAERQVPSLPAESIAVSGQEVTLYFADPKTALLVPVQRRLDVPSANPQAVVAELMAGPKSGEDFDSTLPSGSQLLGSSLAGGVVTLDFNRAFETTFPSSSTASLLALYSLVNSLTCLPGIDKVAFTIEGEPISILGPLDVSEPLGASPDAVLKQQ